MKCRYNIMEKKNIMKNFNYVEEGRKRLNGDISNTGKFQLHRISNYPTSRIHIVIDKCHFNWKSENNYLKWKEQIVGGKECIQVK